MTSKTASLFMLLFLFCLSAAPVFAQLDVSPDIAMYEYKVGESFTVEIKLSDSDNSINAMGFDIYYPDALLQYDSGNFEGTLLANWMLKNANLLDNGHLRVAAMDLQGLIPPSAGTILKISFTVLTAAEGEGVIYLDNFTDDVSSATTRQSIFKIPTIENNWALSFSKSNYVALSEDTISVSVKLSGSGENINSFEFKVFYPDSILTFWRSKFDGTLLNSWSTRNVTEINDNLLHISAADNNGILSPGNGLLVNLQFLVKPNASGTSQISFEDLLGGLSGSSTSNASIKILRSPSWGIQIKAENTDTTLIRIFGGHPEATTNFENSFDEMESLAVSDFRVYFEIPEFPNFLLRDIRDWISPYDNPIEWDLKIINTTMSKLSWKSSMFPPEGDFYLEGNGPAINMRLTESTDVIGDAQLKIIYSKRTDVTFNFPKEGWYLISLPVIPDNTNLSNLFPTALTAFEFSSTSGDYIETTTIEPGKGYWLPIPAATSVTINGQRFESYTSHYTPGWYLAGTTIDTTCFSDPQDTPDGSIVNSRGWNPDSYEYYTIYPGGVEKLIPKQGFWLAVAQECDLTIGANDITITGVFDESLQVQFQNRFGEQPPEPPFIAGILNSLEKPYENRVFSNFPNPFNPETTIKYSLKHESDVQITIYNSLGQKIRTLLTETQAAGNHHVVWNGRNENGKLVSSGIYFFLVSTPEFQETHKMILLK